MEYAKEVADDIINNIQTEFDFSAWESFPDEVQAKCFRELVAEIAYSDYNEVGTVVKEYLETVLTHYAIKEGFAE